MFFLLPVVCCVCVCFVFFGGVVLFVNTCSGFAFWNGGGVFRFSRWKVDWEKIVLFDRHLWGDIEV